MNNQSIVISLNKKISFTMKLNCQKAKELAAVKRQEKADAYNLTELEREILDDVSGVIEQAINRNKDYALLDIGSKQHPGTYFAWSTFIIDHCKSQGYQALVVHHDTNSERCSDKEDIKISGW